MNVVTRQPRARRRTARQAPSGRPSPVGAGSSVGGSPVVRRSAGRPARVGQRRVRAAARRPAPARRAAAAARPAPFAPSPRSSRRSRTGVRPSTSAASRTSGLRPWSGSRHQCRAWPARSRLTSAGRDADRAVQQHRQCGGRSRRAARRSRPRCRRRRARPGCPWRRAAPRRMRCSASRTAAQRSIQASSSTRPPGATTRRQHRGRLGAGGGGEHGRGGRLGAGRRRRRARARPRRRRRPPSASCQPYAQRRVDRVGGQRRAVLHRAGGRRVDDLHARRRPRAASRASGPSPARAWSARRARLAGERRRPPRRRRGRRAAAARGARATAAGSGGAWVAGGERDHPGQRAEAGAGQVEAWRAGRGPRPGVLVRHRQVHAGLDDQAGGRPVGSGIGGRGERGVAGRGRGDRRRRRGRSPVRGRLVGGRRRGSAAAVGAARGGRRSAAVRRRRSVAARPRPRSAALGFSQVACPATHQHHRVAGRRRRAWLVVAQRVGERPPHRRGRHQRQARPRG